MNEMYDLLTALKTALQGADALSYIDDRNIYITHDEDWIPIDVTFPAVALKDGDIEYIIDEGSGYWNPYCLVDVITYQEVKPGDYSVMSNTGHPRIFGLLEINADIHSVMFDNKLEVTGVESAVPVAERKIETIDSKDLSLVRKVITYGYQLFTSPTE